MSTYEPSVELTIEEACAILFQQNESLLWELFPEAMSVTLPSEE